MEVSRFVVAGRDVMDVGVDGSRGEELEVHDAGLLRDLTSGGGLGIDVVGIDVATGLEPASEAPMFDEEDGVEPAGQDDPRGRGVAGSEAMPVEGVTVEGEATEARWPAPETFEVGEEAQTAVMGAGHGPRDRRIEG